MSITDCLKAIKVLAHKIIQKKAEYENIGVKASEKYYEGIEALKIFVKEQKVAHIVIDYKHNRIDHGVITIMWDVLLGFEIKGKLSRKSDIYSLEKISDLLKGSLEKTLASINKEIEIEKKQIDSCENFISVLEEVQKQITLSEQH
ncbi:MAG: hypothetical protein QNJ42_17460 [Crocosphaera sp.]|nr:hypothetical protein [Crocosphaera sp.]